MRHYPAPDESMQSLDLYVALKNRSICFHNFIKVSQSILAPVSEWQVLQQA